MNTSFSTVVPAKDAHILFSSMGFPLDLVRISTLIEVGSYNECGSSSCAKL